MSVETLLADAITAALARQDGGRPLIVGLCGSQGSGKSTVAAALAARIPDTAVLSLDDLYLTRGERVRLGEQVHPLLSTRGVPGTHDVELGLEILDAIGQGMPVALPRFSKRIDDRLPRNDWPVIPANTRVLIFEGWCVGAVPQADAELSRPINAFELAEDEDATYRKYVNGRLAGDYQQLFAQIDLLILLAAPHWEIVPKWRKQQEDVLRTKSDPGIGIMSDSQVIEFVSRYERLTRHILQEMPSRVDFYIELDEERMPRSFFSLRGTEP